MAQKNAVNENNCSLSCRHKMFNCHQDELEQMSDIFALIERQMRVDEDLSAYKLQDTQAIKDNLRQYAKHSSDGVACDIGVGVD